MKTGILLFAILFGLGYLIIKDYPNNIQHRHCGYVVDKYISSAYEYRSGKTVATSDAKLYIIFKSDTIGYTRIEVGVNTYFAFNKGDKICFDLSKHQIENNK